MDRDSSSWPKYQPGHTFGASNLYVLTSTETNTETVIYQPTAGAA